MTTLVKPCRIEQATLDAGVRLIYRDFGDEIRMAYDPAVISAVDARQILALYVESTEGPAIDQLRAATYSAEGDLRELYEIVLGEVDRTGDPKGVAEHTLRLLAQVRAEELV